MCLVCVFLSQEKDAALSDDYGKDLASVQALQRKHEGFEVCRLCAYLQLPYMVSLSSLSRSHLSKMYCTANG